MKIYSKSVTLYKGIEQSIFKFTVFFLGKKDLEWEAYKAYLKLCEIIFHEKFQQKCGKIAQSMSDLCCTLGYFNLLYFCKFEISHSNISKLQSDSLVSQGLGMNESTDFVSLPVQILVKSMHYLKSASVEFM